MGEAALKIVETPEAKALAEYDITEAALVEIKEYEKLEITDGKSAKTVSKCRQVVRTMRTNVEKKRKELKAPLLAHGKLIDKTAKDLTARLLPTEQNLDEKVKAHEAVAAKAKAEKMEAERKRTDAIAEKLADLKTSCAEGLQYGLSSDVILDHLDRIVNFTPIEQAYQEFTPNAWTIIREAIPQVQGVYERAVKFEADQKAQAELEAKNKAEEERLAKIAQEQEEAAKKQREAQEKADAEAKAKREAEEAKLADERKALEDEKAKAAADQKAREEGEAKRLADLEKREQATAWSEYAATLERQWVDEAYRENWKFDRVKEAAVAAFEERVSWCKSIGDLYYADDYNEAHKFQAQVVDGIAWSADIEAATIEARKPDKEKLIAFAKQISAIKLPDLKTGEGDLIAQVADAWLRGCVTEIMAGVESI